MSSTDLPESDPASSRKIEAKPDLRAVLAKLNWRQGSILSPAHVEKIVEAGMLTKPAADSKVVVISHDCDLLQNRLDLEPLAECLIAAPIKKLDGNRSWGKSPRVLHLQIDGRPYEFRVADKKAFPRDMLCLEAPAEHLGEKETDLIADWLSKRYVREAFPNEFENRITNEAWKKIREVLKDGGDTLTGIYLLIVNDELPSGEAYEIAIKATMARSDIEDKEKREAAQSVIDAVASYLRACAGIEVSEADILSHAQVSLQDLEYLKRWDFDDLSARSD